MIRKTLYVFSLTLSFACIFSMLIAFDRTFTINEANLSSIRSACLNTGIDPLINAYWRSYTRPGPEDKPAGVDTGDHEFTNSFGLETLALRTYQAVIQNDPSGYLISARITMYDFPWKTYERALHHPQIPANNVTDVMLNDEWRPTYWQNMHISQDNPAWYRLNAYQRGRELSYNLMFMSFLIDMLYYAYDDSDPYALEQMDVILSKFNEHLQWIRESFFADNQNAWNNLGWERSQGLSYPLGICYDDYPAKDDGSAYRMPTIGNDVNRFVLMCGLGYGAIVTGERSPQNMDFSDPASLIDFVRQEFVSDTEYPAGSGCHGMNDYFVTKTGMFIGGITYQNRALYLTPLFLTALNRVYGINLYNSSNAWNCDLVPKMLRNVLERIDPELQHILQEDDWRYDGINESGVYMPPPYKANHSIQIERGLLAFYYQNEDESDLRENIRWYYKRLKENNSGAYPGEAWEHDFASSFMVVMSYRAGAEDIEADASPPLHYRKRNFSNQELSILRRPLTAEEQYYPASEFRNMNMLTVNHENSFAFAHKNDDKTSYQLYLDGKPIIIEGGYRPGDSWKEWFRNAASHNILLINPGLPTTGSDSEDAYLGMAYETPQMEDATIQFEDPSSPIIYGLWQSYRDNPDLFNPARKEYLFSNNDLSHLKVAVRYRNNVSTSAYNHNNIYPQAGDYPCLVERNFYSIEDKYYLVVDRVQQEVINPQGNKYRNQLHFLDDDKNGYQLSGINNSIGLYQYLYPASSLYLALGSTADTDQYEIRPNLPLGWREWDYEIGKRQERLSVTTNASTHAEDYFLTLLYPYNAENPCPITETTSSPGAYGAVTQKAGSNIMTGVTSGAGINFPQNGFRMLTDSKFFLVEADPGFSSLTKLLILKGSSIEVQDISGTRFPNRQLFLSQADQFEEAIAKWEDGSLSVTLRTARPASPKYKILRCGVGLENFHSSSEYGLETVSIADTTASSRGTIGDNIRSLAYDDLYFYVNYSWNELLAEGVIDDDLILVAATIPETVINTALNLQGKLSITGEITIAPGASLDIRPNSTVNFSGAVGISNHGTLTIDGGTSKSINLKQANQAWSGITNHTQGNLICKNAVIEGAQTGITIRGSSSVTDCEISNCHTGIAIETGTAFTAEWNLIHHNTYACVISNHRAMPVSGLFAHNELSQNSVGILLYNSKPKLIGNNILHNSRAGIYMTRESSPLIKDCHISYTEAHGRSRPELTLEDESYPLLDDAGNDINTDDSGYSLYFASSGRLKPMPARNNYWGTTNAHRIRASIYPPGWDLLYYPFCLVPNTYIPYLEEDLFKPAVTAAYPDARQGDEAQLQIALTDSDSLLCLLDLAYTLQEMLYNDQAKGSHSEAAYQANGLQVSSLQEARQAVAQIWAQILNRAEFANLPELPVPTGLELANYPNPFNPATTIAFSIPETGKVRVAVYNLKGQKVKDLINSELPEGNHKLVWDGKDEANRNVGSGIYFLRLESGGKTSIRKAMLLK